MCIDIKNMIWCQQSDAIFPCILGAALFAHRRKSNFQVPNRMQFYKWLKTFLFFCVGNFWEYLFWGYVTRLATQKRLLLKKNKFRTKIIFCRCFYVVDIKVKRYEIKGVNLRHYFLHNVQLYWNLDRLVFIISNKPSKFYDNYWKVMSIVSCRNNQHFVQ